MAKGNQNSNAVRIDLEVGRPIKEGDKFLLACIVTISDNSGLIDGQEVKIRDDDMNEQFLVTKNGHATYTFEYGEDRAGDKVTITATTEDNNKELKKSIPRTIPPKEREAKEKKPRTERLEIREHGEKGDYTISIQVTDEKGVGIKSKIAVFDSNKSLPVILPNKKRAYFANTDKNGFLYFDLKKFKDKEREIHVRVHGFTQDAKVKKLEGPGPKKKKVKFKKGQGPLSKLNKILTN